MRKKIILRLFLLIVFSISLYSCVHDEIASSTNPSSKEYTNKSLWKEDEKYIKNVMQVYYENETKIKKGIGTPLWNYATTMDHFDESFLMVPVVDNGKVISVLQVPRHEAKVYFIYTESQNDIGFFQNYISPNPKRVLDADISSGTNKLVCVTKTVSTWLPDNEDNPNGTGTWVSTRVTTCTQQQLENCTGIVLPDGECMGGGNDPGYPYPDYGGGGDPLDPEEPEEPEDPCAKTKAIVNKPQIKAKLASLQQHAGTNTKDEDGFQEYKSGSLVNGTVAADNQILFGIGSNSLGTVHTHQPETIHMFAPRDIMTFLDIVRAQDANGVGNAYSGMVSSTGTYFINFTGTASDLPPDMTDAQQEAYVKSLVKEYKKHLTEILESEYKGFGQKASNVGLEKLFFNMLEKMGLKDKIELIKVNEENGTISTSTIEQNSNGIPTPKSC